MWLFHFNIKTLVSKKNCIYQCHFTPMECKYFMICEMPYIVRACHIQCSACQCCDEPMPAIVVLPLCRFQGVVLLTSNFKCKTIKTRRHSVERIHSPCHIRSPPFSIIHKVIISIIMPSGARCYNRFAPSTDLHHLL